MAHDFTRYPAGRFMKDGPYSGERFREQLLLPRLQKKRPVEVRLDSGLSYGSSFLEEAFGGLIRAGIPFDDVLNLLTLTTRNDALREEIESYIRDAAASHGTERD